MVRRPVLAACLAGLLVGLSSAGCSSEPADASTDPAAVFSSIDHHGRYAYGQQPGIGMWNLARLAEALLPLIPGEGKEAAEAATEILRAQAEDYGLDLCDLGEYAFTD